MSEMLSIFAPRDQTTQRGYKCPDCSIIMQTFKCSDVLVDKCGQCHGTWFDDGDIGEFKKVLDSFDLTSLVKLESNELMDNSYQISVCPVCSDPLISRSYAYNTKVNLLVCTKCKGTWLSFLNLLNLIELAHITQVIADDVKGLLKELNSFNLQIEKIQKLKWIVRVLKTKVRRFWY